MRRSLRDIARIITNVPVAKLETRLQSTRLESQPIDKVPGVDVRAEVCRKYRKSHPHDKALTQVLVDMLKQGAKPQPEDFRDTPDEGNHFSRVPVCRLKANLSRKILKKDPKNQAALRDLIQFIEEGAPIAASDLRDTRYEGFHVLSVLEKDLVIELKNKLGLLEGKGEKLPLPILTQFENKTSEVEKTKELEREPSLFTPRGPSALNGC